MLTIVRLLIIGSLFATSYVQLDSAAARKVVATSKKAKKQQAAALKDARTKLLMQAEKEGWSDMQFILAWQKLLADFGLVTK